MPATVAYCTAGRVSLGNNLSWFDFMNLQTGPT